MEFFYLIVALIYMLSKIFGTKSKRQSSYRKPYDKSSQKGEAGEQDIVYQLPSSIPASMIFRNVYMAIKDGLTEVDIVVLDKTGIYVIESKNYNGFISGVVDSKFWKYKHCGGKEYPFYNPIWQNRTHVNAIRNQLKLDNSELMSYVVFGEKSKLGYIRGKTDAKVMQVSEIHNVIQEDIKRRRVVYSDSKLLELQKKLKESTNIGDMAKAKHIRSVELRKYNQ